VTEGKEFPDNTLVDGRPARLVHSPRKHSFGMRAEALSNWQRRVATLKQIG
jgi:hypothetical protein